MAEQDSERKISASLSVDVGILVENRVALIRTLGRQEANNDPKKQETVN